MGADDQWWPMAVLGEFDIQMGFNVWLPRKWKKRGENDLEMICFGCIV